MEDDRPLGSSPTRRVSDADRDRVIAVLRDNTTRGLLTLDELGDRIGLAFQARTVADLAAVTSDLETPPPPPHASPSMWDSIGFRYHALVYGVTNSFLVGTWALTGHGFFWPFFPAAGWGIGLAAHAMAADHHEKSKWQRRTRHAQRRLPAIPMLGVPPVFGPPPVFGTAGAPDPPERGHTIKYVAVLFADVANSTGLNEALGDQSWVQIRARHLALLRECVAARGGAEVSCSGDGLFARFDGPVAAVACAIDIQRRIDQHKNALGFAPSVRIGVHAGEVVEEHDDLVGSVVNVAARVTAEAGPDQILVTEPVAERLSVEVHLDDCGLRVLKGVARPRHLLAVRW